MFCWSTVEVLEEKSPPCIPPPAAPPFGTGAAMRADGGFIAGRAASVKGRPVRPVVAPALDRYNDGLRLRCDREAHVKRFLLATAVIGVALALVACGDDDEEAPSASP